MDTDPTARWLLGAGGDPTRLLDLERGVLEEVAFLETPAGQIFTAYHAPAGREPRGAVLVCAPVLTEAARNYRRELLLATTLAERGIATLRFHPRGSGHSEDHPDAGLDDLVADASAAAAHLADRAGVRSVGFVGTRLGGLVAAICHQRHPGTPLVLWQPVTDPAAWLRELLRARLMTSLKAGASAGGTRQLDAALRRGEPVEIAGHLLSPRLHASLQGRHLDEAMGPPSGPLLVIEMSGRGGVRDDVAALAERWRRGGEVAETDVVLIDEPWWFGSSARMDTYEARTTGLDLVARSVAFLDELLPAVTPGTPARGGRS